MYSCALHNWFSYDFPCPACQKTVSSTTDIVINTEGANETVPYESTDKIEYWRNKHAELQKQLECWKQRCEAAEFLIFESDAKVDYPEHYDKWQQLKQTIQ